jgi:cytochrome c556
MENSTRLVASLRQVIHSKGASMKSLICGASVLTMLALVGATSWSAGAADDSPASIDKIMETLHKGRRSPLSTLKAALKSPSPDWAVVQKQSKTYAKVAADLPKNDPPKGDAASFKKLAKAFAANAKTLEESAAKEDLAATKAAFGKLGSACMTCHDAHKEE